VLRPSLASDNWAGAHPAVMEALAAANAGPAPAYGDDEWTRALDRWIEAEFGSGVSSFPVFTGTAANVIGLLALARPFQAVICSDVAHLAVDECGAPERIAGVKIITVGHEAGRLRPEAVAAAIKGLGVVHHSQPAVLSITQPTELGTVYEPEALRVLCQLAHNRGLRVHLDGARLANAAAALGVSLRAISRDVGVDVLSYGATKNGALAAEVVVVFDADLAGELGFVRKQTMQLASKGRFLAAQLLALAEGERWRESAAHANAMAARLGAGLAKRGEVTITRPIEANAVFATFPDAVAEELLEGADFYIWDADTSEVRLMTSWATSVAEVDVFLALVERALDRYTG
jgi:threonine aldolase